ncbi:MAG: hypothetical protein WC121_11005 [Candidatus Kapaibacterium sp.]
MEKIKTEADFVKQINATYDRFIKAKDGYECTYTDNKDSDDAGASYNIITQDNIALMNLLNDYRKFLELDI